MIYSLCYKSISIFLIIYSIFLRIYFIHFFFISFLHFLVNFFYIQLKKLKYFFIIYSVYQLQISITNINYKYQLQICQLLFQNGLDQKVSNNS
jgi:hypothetical protein